MSKLATVFLLLLLCSSAASPASGQSNYASVGGIVCDPQHQAIPGATVQVTSASTQAARQVATNDQGAFLLTGLLPGEYKLAVEAQGFAPLTQAVNLEVGQQMTLGEVELKISSLTAVVEVTSEAAVLRTSDASVGEVVEPKSVRSLPLNGRMLIDLVLTVPGAHMSHGAQAGDMSPLYWRPGQRSAVSIGERELLPPGRRDRHRPDLQHAQPQPVARRGRGVQGADRQLLRRDGRRGRRADQRRHPHGDERVPRDGLRVPPKRRPRRTHLQPDERRLEAPREEQLRRFVGRPRRPQPELLLRQLRGPATHAGADGG